MIIGSVCYKDFIISSFFVVFSKLFLIAQAGIKICDKVNPPLSFGGIENCSMTCSPHFLQLSSHLERDEYALCNENTTLALLCKGHNDCRQYHMAAACKKTPCLCEGPYGNRIIYTLDAKMQTQIPSLDICTVSTKWINPDSPLVPFPWRTLLVVFGIVASFAFCLVVVRWVSPFIRAMQAKTTARNNQNRRTTSEGDSSALFSTAPMPEPRTYIPPSSRNRRPYDPSPSISSVSIDKPPPYEVAVQGPPTYDELECEPLNPVDESVTVEQSFSRLPRRSITRTTSAVSITTV